MIQQLHDIMYLFITKETVSQITKENPKENPRENHITQKQKLLFFLSIGICGLGLIIYSQRNKVLLLFFLILLLTFLLLHFFYPLLLFLGFSLF
jgi:hypothetical protein